MIGDTYLAPNGWSLKWRMVNRIGDLTLYDAEGQRQTATSGVVTQATFDRAVKELGERAAREMQLPLFEIEVRV